MKLGAERLKTMQARFRRTTLVVLDDYSNFAWLFFLKAKSEVVTKMEEFVAGCVNDEGWQVKRFRCDGGGEFVGP